MLFTRVKLAVFIDGCFWHSCPLHSTQPIANGEWWRMKLDANVNRDRATDEHLESVGWNFLRFWEHEDPEYAAHRIIVTHRTLFAEIRLL